MELRELLHRTAEEIARYREALPELPVAPDPDWQAGIDLPRELPDGPAAPEEVFEELVAAATPGLMASAGPRYFGFVTGGSLDAALVADLMVVGWDQLAFNAISSPASVLFEEVAGTWLKQLLGLPADASVGFVTGGGPANTVCLAAARWQVLHDAGWDVNRDGLAGAPRIRVVAGAERHATIDRSLRILGLGEGCVEPVPVTGQGALDAERLPEVLAAGPPGPTIVCAQAGNVNTGACDDLTAIGAVARDAGAWLHVDGAFGLWAAASPATRHLVAGAGLADSWGCDGHKWLNVPYDSGFAICARPEAHAEAMRYTASYLTGQQPGHRLAAGDFTPESSRRARGVAVWAAIRSLGASGVADLVERCCALVRRLAEGAGRLDGVDIVNDVVLNQVLLRVAGADTDAVAERVQRDGACWLGTTTWRGERLLRVSVSGASTTEADIDRSVDAIGRAVDAVRAG
jgi:glutamate/tyrosine decarboxylase-like PLP-dependent enzyme